MENNYPQVVNVPNAPFGNYSPFASIEHLGINNRVSDAAHDILGSVHAASLLGQTAGCDNARFTNKEVTDGTRYTAKEVNDSTRLLGKDICDTARQTADVVTNGVYSLKSGQSEQYVNLRDAVERTGVANLTAIERNHGESRFLTQALGTELGSKIDRNNTSVLLANKDTLLEMCKFHGQTQLQISETTCALGRQASENTAAIQLEAFKHKEILSKQLAECCCALKEKIDLRAAETNQTFREIENQRVRDALSAATNENMFLKMCKNGSQ